MKKIFMFIALMLAASLLSFTQSVEAKDSKKTQGDNKKVETKEFKDLKKVRAVIETKYGEIELVFFPDKAPGHVNNFIKLVQSGFYDGTIFHRVIPGFMIQGGDPNTKYKDNTSNYGMGGPGYNIKAEFNEISHERGILSMARAADPNSAGSQFFIVVKDSTFLDRQYTVFGKVVKGMDVADKIVSQPRNRMDLPNERIEMKIRVYESEEKTFN